MDPIPIPIQRILVATDFSPSADDALGWAIELARPLDAEILLVHSQPTPTPILPDLIHVLLEQVRKELEERSSRVKTSGIRVRSIVRTGEPWRELRQCAIDEGADLVVLGSRGLGDIDRLLTGSVAERVVRSARCSVVAVPERKGKASASPIRRIVVGTDFSEGADRAIDGAVALAHRLGASVTIVHAYEVPPEGFPREMHEATPDMLDAYARRATERLEAEAGERRSSGVAIETALRKGTAADGILQAASMRDADLVVVGTHGRSTIGRWLIGSVSERVVRTSAFPTLVVRA